jgi:hypothetical protein
MLLVGFTVCPKRMVSGWAFENLPDAESDLNLDGPKSAGYYNQVWRGWFALTGSLLISIPLVTTSFVTPSFWPQSETTWPIIVTVFFKYL